MFRFSNTTSIFELEKQKGLMSNGQRILFAPSNSILPLQLAPIFTQNKQVSLRKWGFADESERAIISISLEDAITSASKFEPCIVPTNGYFINFNEFCIFMHDRDEHAFYAAGILTGDSFLFVTTEQFNVYLGTPFLPLILDESYETQWLSKEWDAAMKSKELLVRNVSRLTLSNTFYNGNRCTEEYFNFELQTKTLNLAKEACEKEFPKNKDWFDE
jgi:putative SOS response-associated peptidase YedK